METHTILLNCLLGLILGVSGQVVRAVAGLRKHFGVSSAPSNLPPPVVLPSADPTVPSNTALADRFSWTEFGVSLILGGVSGIIASVILWDKMQSIDKNVVLGLIAAGYAGSDFLDGIIKWLPKPPTGG